MQRQSFESPFNCKSETGTTGAEGLLKESILGYSEKYER